MPIPLPVILDFELHATVLGHPATVALRRVVEGARHWYSYEYHISQAKTRTVTADTPTAILFVALDALAAGSYPKAWRWQADLPKEQPPVSDSKTHKTCGLIIYGDVQATLVAAEPMTEQAWREIINSAAKRCDAVRDNGAPPETPTEATAIEDGLSFLICHRRPDITNADDFIMLAPELPGW